FASVAGESERSRRAGVGVVPDEQSCAPGAAAGPRRFFELVAAPRAWPLCAVLQHALGADWASVAEPVFQLHFGKRASMGGTGVRGAKSSPSRHGRFCR